MKINSYSIGIHKNPLVWPGYTGYCVLMTVISCWSMVITNQHLSVAMVRLRNSFWSRMSVTDIDYSAAPSFNFWAIKTAKDGISKWCWGQSYIVLNLYIETLIDWLFMRHTKELPKIHPDAPSIWCNTVLTFNLLACPKLAVGNSLLLPLIG